MKRYFDDLAQRYASIRSPANTLPGQPDNRGRFRFQTLVQALAHDGTLLTDCLPITAAA